MRVVIMLFLLLPPKARPLYVTVLGYFIWALLHV